MKTLSLVIGLVLLAQTDAQAQVSVTAKTDSLIELGIQYTIQQAYEKAEAIFTEIENEMPDSPVGYFFHAATLQSKMMDYEIYDEEDAFFALAEKTVKLSQMCLKKDRKNPWTYFFLGGGLGYIAFYQAKQKRYLEGFQNGLKSIKALEMTLKADTTFYDAYFGLGTYKYYRSKLSRHFKWLPFVSDERMQGLAMIQLAISRGKYTRYAAMNGYCWIALAEGDLNEGMRILKQALSEFPTSRVFLWCAAKMSTKLQKWPDALHYYNTILASLQNENKLSLYNEVSCRQKLAAIYLQLGNFDKALEEYKKVQALDINGKTKKRLSQTLKKLEKVKNISYKKLGDAQYKPGAF
ncbi:MAG: tetratricopeptide repeat protein [bacterium]